VNLAIVVQRYGQHIVGGAEAHARRIAHHLSRWHRVTVATTAASDHLAWKNDLPSIPVGGFIPPGAFAPVALAPLGDDDDEKIDQRKDDDKVNGAPANAARWASILYQAPVMVAIHAAEMLRPKGPDRG